jgi:DNA-binding beta-propeller fold protein YncE
VIPSQWARIDYDQQNNEIYTLNPRSNEVQIFNREGMKIFTFGGDGDIPSLIDVTAGDGGRIYGLPRRIGAIEVRVFNYRGLPESVIVPQGLPEELQHFRASRIEYQDGKLYLLDSKAMKLILLSRDGTVLKIHDFGEKLREIADRSDPDKKKSIELDIGDFSLDPNGNIYFTAPLIFTAFRVNGDGTVNSFGRSGSGPGKFGVVAGIAADEQGNIYVADRLRSVVLLFNSDFKFQGEFGYRGGLPEDLLVPDSIAIDQKGNRVFVAQGANKGVGAYKVIFEK